MIQNGNVTDVFTDGGNEMTTSSLYFELYELKRKYYRLVEEGKLLQDEHRKNVKDFLESQIFDSEHEEDLVNSSCNISSSQLRLKIAFSKMENIRTALINRGIHND